VDTITPVPESRQLVSVMSRTNSQFGGASVVVLVVVVELVLEDVVVVVDGFGTNVPTKKSNSSQQLFNPE
jgi:hypothetical protein